MAYQAVSLSAPAPYPLPTTLLLSPPPSFRVLLQAVGILVVDGNPIASNNGCRRLDRRGFSDACGAA